MGKSKAKLNVRPFAKNAKKHPDKQLLALANIVKEVGWRQPVVVNQDAVIVVGHGRWFTYQKHKESHNLKEIWVIDDKGTTLMGAPETKAMTEAQENTYRFADNKLNESDWDMPLALEGLKELSLDMFALTGFDSDLLLENEDKDDEIPAIPDKARSKLGDLYELGRHRLLCGDSASADEVLRLLEGARADMVFTDPPYNVAYNVAYKGMQNSKQWEPIANDDMDDGQFEEFLKAVFKNYQTATKPTAAFYVCHADKSHKEFRLAFEAEGLEWRATIIWVKNSPAFNFAQYKYKHEPIFYLFKKGKTVKWYGENDNNTVWKKEWNDKQILKWFREQQEKQTKTGVSTIWEAKKEKGEHPTIKPVELILKALTNSSRRGDIVLDFFLGSGSTLIASEKAERTCYGLELNPHYVDVIVQRYVDYTSNEDIIKNGKPLKWPAKVRDNA